MTISIPNRAVVLIYGPSCSGKSTLAEKIITETPHTSKGIHSGDQALNEIYAAHPELAPYSLISMGLIATSAQPPAVLRRLQKEISLLMTEMVEAKLQQCDLLVMDEIRLDPDIVLYNLAMLHVMSHHRPIVLIKMMLADKVYQLFYEKRQDDRRLPRNLLDAQRKRFDKVGRYNFGSSCSYVAEYIVLDPREISLSFA